MSLNSGARGPATCASSLVLTTSVTHHQPPTPKALLQCLMCLLVTTNTLTLQTPSAPTLIYSQSLLQSMQTVLSCFCITTPIWHSYLQSAVVSDQVSGHLPTQRNQKTHQRGMLHDHKDLPCLMTSHRPS